MSLALQIVLILFVVAVGACLVPLLIQIRRTARAVEELAQGARRDLASIAEDVHGARVQLDRVSGMVERSLEMPTTIGASVARFIQRMTGLLEHAQSPWFDAAVTAGRIALDYFRRPRGAEPGKEKTDE